jgi:hypothetical protein
MSLCTSNANQDILNLYEQGLSPECIAEDLGWEVEAVKAILGSQSTLYRSKIKSGEECEDITDEEYRELLKAYKSVAIYSDVDAVRERALRFLINERKGRNDNEGILRGGNFNITLINAHIKNAKQEMKRILDVEVVKEDSTIGAVNSLPIVPINNKQK